MKKENDFLATYHAVCSVLPRELAEKLRQESPYWAPEVRWYNLTHFINTRMKQSHMNAAHAFLVSPKVIRIQNQLEVVQILFFSFCSDSSSTNPPVIS